MKTITFCCNIQIDVPNEATIKEINEIVEIINLELQEISLNSQPQIMPDSVSIEIENNDDDFYYYLDKIYMLVDNLTEVDLKTPFVGEKSNTKEEITGVFKDEMGKLNLCTWNNDNGGDREEDSSNTMYDFDLFGEDLLTVNDMKEIYKQLQESDQI